MHNASEEWGDGEEKKVYALKCPLKKEAGSDPDKNSMWRVWSYVVVLPPNTEGKHRDDRFAQS